MASRYEFWLTDDGGRRIIQLQGFSYVSYSRTRKGFGTFQIGFPLKLLEKMIYPVFEPDRRIDVWRAPSDDQPLRREQIYLLRKPRIYTRKSDSMEIIELFGRDPKDLLNRRYVIQGAGTSYTRKTNFIDDMMKEIVREQMLYGNALDPDGTLSPDRAFPTGEFLVQADKSLGPSVTWNFADRNVLDTLKDLTDTTVQMYNNGLTNNVIYFDVMPYDVKGAVEKILDEQNPSDPILDEMGMALLDEISLIANAEIGFRFETFAGLRGQDRTLGVVYSVENGNLEEPTYSKDHLDERNSIVVKGFGRGDSRAWDIVDDDDRIHASRWNRYESFLDASNEPDQNKLADFGYEQLEKNKPKEELNATFLNVPEGPDTPRSLYGIDWDLGDLLPVSYAGKNLNVEVDIVYVSLNESGEENITGRNDINAGNQD